MTLFAGDEAEVAAWYAEWDGDPADEGWVEVGPSDDGPGLDWFEGPDEPPPSRRVATIKTTGDRL